MRRFVVAVALVGCSRDAKPTAPTNTQGHQIRFAMTVGNSVQIVRVSDGALVVESTTKVPAHVSRMFWVGPSPAVWLDMSIGEMGEGFPRAAWDPDPRPAGPHQNEMGLATPTGYRKFPTVTWPPAKKASGEFAEDMSEVTEENRALVATADSLWEKRCRWYGGPDGGWCEYEYARLYPEPVVFATEKDVGSTEQTRVFPSVEPATTIKLEHYYRLRDKEREDDFDNRQHLISCAPKGGAKIEYPPATELDHDVMEQVRWLSTEPPVFVTAEGVPYVGVGREPPLFDKIWEGCARSERYTDVFTGPDDVVVLTGREVSVLQRGREIAHSPTGGGLVAFAPR